MFSTNTRSDFFAVTLLKRPYPNKEFLQVSITPRRFTCNRSTPCWDTGREICPRPNGPPRKFFRCRCIRNCLGSKSSAWPRRLRGRFRPRPDRRRETRWRVGGNRPHFAAESCPAGTRRSAKRHQRNRSIAATLKSAPDNDRTVPLRHRAGERLGAPRLVCRPCGKVFPKCECQGQD